MSKPEIGSRPRRFVGNNQHWTGVGVAIIWGSDDERVSFRPDIHPDLLCSLTPVGPGWMVGVWPTTLLGLETKFDLYFPKTILIAGPCRSIYFEHLSIFTIYVDI